MMQNELKCHFITMLVLGMTQSDIVLLREKIFQRLRFYYLSDLHSLQLFTLSVFCHLVIKESYMTL